MRLASHVAVAVEQARSCSSNSTPSLGTSICHSAAHPTPPPKKGKLNPQAAAREAGSKSPFREKLGDRFPCFLCSEAGCIAIAVVVMVVVLVVVVVVVGGEGILYHINAASLFPKVL